MKRMWYVNVGSNKIELSDKYNVTIVFNYDLEIIESNMIEDKNSKKIFDSARKQVSKVIKFLK
jgi:hypothetical protein